MARMWSDEERFFVEFACLTSKIKGQMPDDRRCAKALLKGSRQRLEQRSCEGRISPIIPLKTAVSAITTLPEMIAENSEGE